MCLLEIILTLTLEKVENANTFSWEWKRKSCMLIAFLRAVWYLAPIAKKEECLTPWKVTLELNNIKIWSWLRVPEHMRPSMIWHQFIISFATCHFVCHFIILNIIFSISHIKQYFYWLWYPDLYHQPEALLLLHPPFPGAQILIRYGLGPLTNK